MATKKTGQGPRRPVPEVVERNARYVRMLSDTLYRQCWPINQRKLTVEIFRRWMNAHRKRFEYIPLPGPALAKKLSVDGRTIRRHLTHLRNAGVLVPVEHVDDRLVRMAKPEGGASPTLYWFDSRALFGLTGGGNELRTALLHDAWLCPPEAIPAEEPRTFTPDKTPDRPRTQTPDSPPHFTLENQPVNAQTFSRTEKGAPTPDRPHHLPVINQLVEPDSAPDSPLLICHAHSRNSLSSLAAPVEADGRAGHEEELKPEASLIAAPVDAGLAGQMDEPQTSTCESATVCQPLLTGEGLAVQIVAGQGIAAPCPALHHDAQTLLTHLEKSGPSSYGAAASDLGWGNTRAWQAEAELQAAGAIQRDPIGRMVPTQKHREAFLLPDTFHERNIT
jgi:hypothetical protein